jgi:hypothetical protein
VSPHGLGTTAPTFAHVAAKRGGGRQVAVRELRGSECGAVFKTRRHLLAVAQGHPERGCDASALWPAFVSVSAGGAVMRGGVILEALLAPQGLLLVADEP